MGVKKGMHHKNMFWWSLMAARQCTAPVANKDANENQNQIERDPEIERCTFAKVAARNEQT